MQATGTGEVSIAASLHFVPARLLPFPAYRGIYVEAAIQVIQHGALGQHWFDMEGVGVVDRGVGW